jgi:hypothetical protein
MTTSQKEIARASAEAVSAIDTLARRPEFHHFLDSLRRREKQYADSILNDDAMPHDEREKLRQRRMELVEVIEWHVRERQAHVSVLASFGIQPGDGLEVGM